jgi:hypothetical protein
VATVTPSGGTWNTTTGTHTSTTTPAVGDLIVIICANAGLTKSSPPTVTDNNADGLGTYTQAVAADLSGAPYSLFIYVRDAKIGSATSTTYSVTGASSTGGGLFPFRIAGLPSTSVGAAAIRATGKQESVAAGTPAVALPQAALTGNPLLGAVLTQTNGTANCAPPAGWTEQNDLGFATPNTGIATNYIASGETGSTITFGAATPSTFSAVVVEIVGEIIGTGDLAAGAAAFSGTSTQEFTGTGAFGASASALAGTGIGAITGTGALAPAAAAFSGTGTETVTGTGAFGAAAAVFGAAGIQEAQGGTGSPGRKRVTFLDQTPPQRRPARPKPTPVKGSGGIVAAPAALDAFGLMDDSELVLLLLV